MKKMFVGAIFGIVLTISTTIAFAVGSQFSDINGDEWYASAVENLANKGILQGYPDGSFGPGKTPNRAELAVVLDRMLEYMETGEVSGTVWKTFESNTYGVSFDYPPELIAQDCTVLADGSVTPGMLYQAVFTETVICPYPEGVSGPALELVFTISSNESAFWCKIDASAVPTTVDGVASYRCLSSYFGEGKSPVVQFMKDGHVFTLSGSSHENTFGLSDDAFVAMFDEVIASVSLN